VFCSNYYFIYFRIRK